MAELLVEPAAPEPAQDAFQFRGEFQGAWALLGPNGAGKSAFLSLIHFGDTHQKGRVKWEGQNAASSKARRGYVSQRPIFFDGSVRRNLHFARRALRISRSGFDARLNNLAHELEISHLLDRPARALSGGEQARVNIARALIGAPQILLLDEPTAHLDQKSTAIIEELIRNFAALESNLALFVTHDHAQLARIGANIIHIREGKIEDTGSIDQISHHIAP